MNELDFRTWLQNEQLSHKVQGDLVSRLKKLERAFENRDIDDEYRSDRCAFLLSLFRNTGINPDMEKFCNSLPVGKYHLSAYKYALQKYVAFMDATSAGR